MRDDGHFHAMIDCASTLGDPGASRDLASSQHVRRAAIAIWVLVTSAPEGA